jgi:uncharacterized protein YceK
MRTLIICTASLLLLSACATAPSDIQPAKQAAGIYSGLTLDQLRTEERRLQRDLDEAARKQEQTRTKDAWGMAFLLLPVSSMAGSNNAKGIAEIKGKLLAVRDEIESRERTAKN